MGVVSEDELPKNWRCQFMRCAAVSMGRQKQSFSNGQEKTGIVLEKQNDLPGPKPLPSYADRCFYANKEEERASHEGIDNVLVPYIGRNPTLAPS